MKNLCHITKYTWCASSLQVITSLVSCTVPPMLNFLKKETTTTLLNNTDCVTVSANQMAEGVQEVTSFLRMFSALLDQHFLREDYEKKGSNCNGKDTKSGPQQPEPTSSAEGGKSSSTSGSHSWRSRAQSGMTKMEDLIPNYMAVLRHMYGLAFIWGFGGSLHER